MLVEESRHVPEAVSLNRRALLAAPILAAGLSMIARASGAEAGAPLSTEEHRISARERGVELYLRNKRRSASTDAAPGATLLLLHGLTYPGSAVFDLPLAGASWMDHLALAGHDVWALDIRGFGRSTKPAIFDQPASENPPYLNAADAVSDLASAIDFIRSHRNPPRLTLLAWSWGTVLAAAYAAENPGMVERLVLYAPIWQWQGPGPSPSAPEGAYRSVTREAARSGWLNAAPEPWRKDLLPEGWFDAWAAAVFATDPAGARMNPPVLRVPNGPLVEVAEHWRTGQTFFDPAAITMPTKIVVAEWDRTTPPNQALALFQRLENAPDRCLVVLPRGTHSIFLERNRDKLFSTVQSFLASEATGKAAP